MSSEDLEYQIVRPTTPVPKDLATDYIHNGSGEIVARNRKTGEVVFDISIGRETASRLMSDLYYGARDE